MLSKNNLTLLLISLCFSSLVIAATPDEQPLKPAKLIGANQAMIARHADLFNILSNIPENSSEEKSAAYGRIGMFYHAHDLIQNAEDFYLQAIKNSPYNAKWYHLLAITYVNQGKYEKAIRSVKSAIKNNDYYLPSKIILAETYLQISELEKAIEYFNLILKDNPAEVKSHAGLGLTYLQLGENEKALKSLLKALSIQPSANQLHFQISQAYAGLGDEKNAELHLSLKGDLVPTIYDTILQDMRKETLSSSFYINLALDAFRAKDYKASETLAARAVSYDPKSVYPKFMLANAYVKLNKSTQALKIIDKLISNNPNLSRAYYAKASILEAQNLKPKALTLYKKAVTVNPQDKEAARFYSLALMRNGYYQLALNSLQNAKKLNPDNAYLIYREASILAYQKQCKNSLVKIEEALNYLPSNLVFNSAYIRMVLACSTDTKLLTKIRDIAKDIYYSVPSQNFTKLLAMTEMKLGNKNDAIDYQTQLIFQAYVDKASKQEISALQKQLVNYRNNVMPIITFTKEDSDLNPELPWKF
jgi:tetratricopeptide (TPR) repeat protein